jgi:hypothetical protein
VFEKREDLGKQILTRQIPNTYASLEPPSKAYPEGRTVMMWPFDQQVNWVRLFVSRNIADKPTWVDCDENPVLAQVIAQTYGCPTQRPKRWKRG